MKTLVELQTPASRVLQKLQRVSGADVGALGFKKVEQLGGLATAIFECIASTDGDARGLFSAEAAADYSRVVGRSIGREVRVEEIQPIVNDLLASNLIMRKGRGTYGVTDPFVQEIWREKRVLESKG